MALSFPQRTTPWVLSPLLLVWVVGSAAGGEPPDYFARLIDEGNVTFVFYDPVREPRTHQGYTTFRYDVSYQSSYQYRWLEQPTGRQLTIEAEISGVECVVSNQVELPNEFRSDRNWTNSLVRHEFDHVAMTVDPRARMLIEYLCKRTPTIVRTVASSTTVTDEMVERLIHETVDPRYQAVLELLFANEQDLDIQTRHGMGRLPDRRAYFGALFTEPNLKQHRFRFLEEVRPLLRTKKFREAKLPYDFGG